MFHLPEPSHRRIPITQAAANSRHDNNLRSLIISSKRRDLVRGEDIGNIVWHYLVDEEIHLGDQKPYEGLRIKLEARCWDTKASITLPKSDLLPIEIVDALLGESPRRRYHDRISLRDADGTAQDYLVVGGYCDARLSETSFTLMVVKPGDCLPALDAAPVPIFSEGDARIILGRDPVFASAAYLSAADGEEFVPDRNTGVRWYKMRTGWIQDAVMHAHQQIVRRERAAGLR
jgi:hypothetical protein